MPTCDSQIHLFPVGSEERVAKFGQTVVPLDRVLAEMDGAGIDRAVLVPTREDLLPLSLEAVDAYPDRFRVMVSVPAEKQDVAEPVLATLPTDAIIGVRVTFPPWQKPSALTSGAADWFWPAVVERDLPVMVWAPRKLPDLAPVAENHPELRLIVDHFGLFVDDRDDDLDPVIDRLVGLAALPNVSVKASALPCATSEEFPYPRLLRRVERVVDAFGAERVFWGSDMTRLPCPYAQAVSMLTEHAAFLDDRQRELVMGEALLRLLRWS